MKPEAAMQIIGAIHNIQEHAYPLMSIEEGDAFDANLARLIDAVMTGYGPMSESSIGLVRTLGRSSRDLLEITRRINNLEKHLDKVLPKETP